MELAESSAEAQQRSRRAMARHDTVKYEADSLYLAFRRLQYSTKKTGRLKIGDSVRQASELGKPPCRQLDDRDSHDDFIQSTGSVWQL